MKKIKKKLFRLLNIVSVKDLEKSVNDSKILIDTIKILIEKPDSIEAEVIKERHYVYKSLYDCIWQGDAHLTQSN